MASAVDIANLALSRIGDNATVSSIDPPEGSPQAAHCALFYPMARDTLLAWPKANWSFASRRKELARVTMPWSTWQYAYAVPNSMLSAIAVLSPDAPDDYTTSFPIPYSPQEYPGGARGISLGYQPQPFVIESDDNGQQVIYTNQENATLRFIARVTDTTKYPPMFVDALVWLLASHIAGPIIKGDAGKAAANDAYGAFLGAVGRAVEADTKQRKVNVVQNVPWISNR
jgi:hypothetical protein